MGLRFDQASHRIQNFLRDPNSKFYRVFRHRDFRLLWFGAFFSFVGSWIQIVGQGFLVYEITGSKEKLALISFCASIPVTFLGPFTGGFVDAINKRLILVGSQVFFAVTAILIALLVHFNALRVEHLVIVALLNGVVSAFEMPARQSVFGLSVPKEDLPVAIPFQGLTFNLARVVGPAIGGFLLTRFSAEACYWANGVSFLALICAGLAIKVDLSSKNSSDSSVMDLIVEGFKYTVRDERLKMLLYLDILISLGSLFYLAQVPAIAKDILGEEKAGIGHVYMAFGIGSVVALMITAKTADLHIKGILIRVAVTLMGVCLLIVSYTRSLWIAYPFLLLLGLSSIIIFNTCNSLFQMIAPERLRGRVVSMHIWAMNGVGPLGTYAMGWLADKFTLAPILRLGGVMTLFIAAWAWSRKLYLEAQSKPEPDRSQ